MAAAVSAASRSHTSELGVACGPVQLCHPVKGATASPQRYYHKQAPHTPPIAKVLEGFSAESLITSVFNKLDNKQFALPGRSTTQALIFFKHTILETLDTCGRYIRISFSDFSKGFDLVDHNVLLSDLKNLDVDHHLVRWIAAFLTNRSQRVRIGNSLSPPVGLKGGTAPGTKLASLLFCILVN